MCPSFEGEEQQLEERKEYPTDEQKEALLLLVQNNQHDQLAEMLSNNPNWNLNFMLDGMMYQTTLLHEAAGLENLDIVQLLIAHGMQRDILDALGYTPADRLRQLTYDHYTIPDGLEALLVPQEHDIEDDDNGPNDLDSREGSRVEDSNDNETGHHVDGGCVPSILVGLQFPGGSA